MDTTLRVQAAPSIAPDKSVWIGITVTTGIGSFSFGVPIDQASELRQHLYDVLNEAMADGRKLARERRSNLVVPCITSD